MESAKSPIRCVAGIRSPLASSSAPIVFFVSAGRGSPHTSVKSTRSVSGTICLGLARATRFTAALEIPAWDDSRFILSSHREIYVDGEFVHALDIPRDHPRTRQPLLERFDQTFPAATSRSSLQLERPLEPPCARSFQAADRLGRPRAIGGVAPHSSSPLIHVVRPTPSACR